jgi:hypothetical protein
MHTLLFGVHLSTYVWEEALRTANYISNRTPHRALHIITPLELYTGQKSNNSHLKVYGCKSYAHL